MSFDLQAFIAAPSQELLNFAKKSDLLDIAAHYELTNVNKSMLKLEIKKIFWFNFWLIRKYLILLLCPLLSQRRQVCKCKSLKFRGKLSLKKNKIRKI